MWINRTKVWENVYAARELAWKIDQIKTEIKRLRELKEELYDIYGMSSSQLQRYRDTTYNFWKQMTTEKFTASEKAYIESIKL